jgi:hypothetical protein
MAGQPVNSPLTLSRRIASGWKYGATWSGSPELQAVNSSWMNCSVS